MYKILLIYFFLLFLPCFIFAEIGVEKNIKSASQTAKESETISITKVKIEEITTGDIKAIAEITINDAIKIKDIKIGKSGNIQYPAYISKSGKEYIQFEPISKQAKNEIENTLKTKKLSNIISKEVSYKIIEFRPIKSKYRKINVKLMFNNSFTVSCGIMEGQNGPWIAWPSEKNEKSGGYKKQVVFMNTKLRNTIEKNLISKYISQKSSLNPEEE